MLDLPQTIAMFAPRPIHSVDDVDAKFNATRLCCQTPAVQIIQLVECTPPPRRIISPESLYASSSSAPTSSSSCSEEEEEEEEEDESECSSYCSSEEPVAGAEYSSPQSAPSADTYNIRMKRILAWREDFSSHLSSTLSDPSITSSLKRKISISADYNNDAMSHSSKRSRSQLSSRGQGTNSSRTSLGALSCPACDASFDTRQDLRQHGHDARAGAKEACFVAVDYAFE
jgi:hypothetical protein